MLADDPVFLAEDDRKGLLLQVLAAVKPMSERTVTLFQQTNDDGYFAMNAPLLAANGSPRALALFESMMLERDVPIDRRIDCLHFGIVPRRTELPILQAADRILSRAAEHALAMGVIESVFDYRPGWFGLAVNSPTAPTWQGASENGLRLALALADKALARRDLKPALRQAVDRSRGTIAQVLTARRK